jgi:hypothetical protein
MASLLALSVLCILPNSHHSLAWTSIAHSTNRRRNLILRQASFLSTVPAAVTESLELDSSLGTLPEPLVEALIRFTSSSVSTGEDSHLSPPTSPKLLPIQLKSYEVIANGGDAVLFSPTGTGKSLAFILPLAARLWEWKRDGSLLHKKQAQKQRFMRKNRSNGNDSLSSQTVDAASPSILVVEPSRELARQVGKIWEKFHPTAAKGSKRHVVTVYGGVPMTRHAALLGSKTDVVVGSESPGMRFLHKW